MIKITDALTTEHATLRTLFRKIEKLLPKIQSQAELSIVVQLVETILHRHDEDEERLFFSALRQTTQHIAEVEALSLAHGRLDAQLLKVCKGADLAKNKQSLIKALDAIRAHFNHEELEIFPKLKDRFSKESLKALGGAWLNQRSHL
jgi:hemerythrin-like domain-containing protein